MEKLKFKKTANTVETKNASLVKDSSCQTTPLYTNNDESKYLTKSLSKNTGPNDANKKIDDEDETTRLLNRILKAIEKLEAERPELVKRKPSVNYQENTETSKQKPPSSETQQKGTIDEFPSDNQKHEENHIEDSVLENNIRNEDSTIKTTIEEPSCSKTETPVNEKIIETKPPIPTRTWVSI